MIEFTGEFGERAARRLRDEQIVWLTTIGRDGTPQPSPVWFLWEDGAAIIYSKPDAPKVGNITRQSRVALSFNSTEHGGDVVILTGTAEALEGGPLASTNAAYIAKYSGGLDSLKMTPESFAAEYPMPIRVTPEKLRGF
jgi:PPOX class probable F420-dependent enzyme